MTAGWGARILPQRTRPADIDFDFPEDPEQENHCQGDGNQQEGDGLKTQHGDAPFSRSGFRFVLRGRCGRARRERESNPNLETCPDTTSSEISGSEDEIFKS
jgi:hypothetical protein